MQVDEAGFEQELNSQKKRSREALKSIDLTAGRLLGDLAGQLGASDFIGYEHGSLRTQASVLAILKEGKTVDSASSGTDSPLLLAAETSKRFACSHVLPDISHVAVNCHGFCKQCCSSSIESAGIFNAC